MYANATNVTSYVGLLNYANTVSDGWFNVGILISLFIILVISTIRTSKEDSFALAGFITLLCAILMRVMDMIPDLVLIICVMVFFGTVFMLFTKDRQ